MRVLIAMSFVLAVITPSLADEIKLNKVKARSLELLVPTEWKAVDAASTMRVAQFEIPDDEGTADLVVFYFGGPTGGVKANVQRWIGQFDEKDRKLQMFQGKCAAGTYIWVDTVGTWNKPDGPPFAQKKIATPNSRVVNVIVVEEKEDEKDYYFLKLSGNQDVVTKHIEALTRAIGVVKDSQKPFELKDAPN